MKLLAMIQRVIIELLKDKRTLALMFLAPLLVLTLMYFIFNSNFQIMVIKFHSRSTMKHLSIILCKTNAENT